MTYRRRLLFLVVWLALFDSAVLPVRDSLERGRYERGAAFRFENSDLFGLGPLVAYLREHPRSDRLRVAFFGNSVIWGYQMTAPASVPAQFEALDPGARVFNLGVNGFEMGSAYLIAKAVMGSVDHFFVQLAGTGAHPSLPSLIPVAEADIERFGLQGPNTLERQLQSYASIWRLYANAYRIQAAALGTSTRQYVYLHKGEMARNLLAGLRGIPAANAATPAASAPSATILLTVPRASAPPSAARREELRRRYPLLWDFEELVRLHGRQAHFLVFAAEAATLPDDAIGDLNILFEGSGEIILVTIPPGLLSDGVHLTPGGARAVAETLLAHTRDGRRVRP